MPDIIYSIYKITNQTNGKFYIGQTIQPEKRKQDHFTGFNSSPILTRAINKYGKENFTFDIIYQTKDSFEHIMEMERFFIAKFKATEIGYNLCDGGLGRPGAPLTLETKEKIREKAMGRKHTEATKKKLSESHKGYVMPEAQKEAISRSMSGKKKTKEHLENLSKSLKIAWTPEMRQKASLAQASKKHSPEALAKLTEANQRKAKKYLITKPDGSQETITNLNKFCKENGLSQSCMSALAHGRMKSPHNGFVCQKFPITSHSDKS